MTEKHFGFSGRGMPDFRGGWARIPFRGALAHYWTELEMNPPMVAEGGRVRFFRSVCQMEAITRPRVPALGVGDLGWCKRCAKKHGGPNARERLNAIEQTA